jgi:hypothetical protein
VRVTLPSLPALAAPACPSPDMRWAHRARPCARRPAGPGRDVRVLRPGGQIVVPTVTTTF